MKAVSCEEIEDLIRQHKVSGGMVLKLEACKRALSAGVSQVRIVGGANEARLALGGERREGSGHARDAELSGGGAEWGSEARKSKTKAKAQAKRSRAIRPLRPCAMPSAT